mgnify:CR=1 FL=1
MQIAVLGNVFIDYKGWAGEFYDPVGRNQGKIEIVHGGVARNVAENLALLGLKPEFVTTLGYDSISDMVAKRLADNRVSMNYISKHEQNAIGMWLAILGNSGNLLGSISQLSDMQLLEDLIIDKLPALAGSIKNIAMDIDLTPRIAEKVVEHVQKDGLKLYALPGNLTVIKPHPQIFQYMECFICNDIEAGKLLDEEMLPKNPEHSKAMAKALCKKFHIKQAVITLGEYGAVYCDPQGNIGYQDIYPTVVNDTTGAGDAFFSAAVAALIQGHSLELAVQAGSKLASIIVARSENTCHCLSKEQLENIFLK